MRQAKIKAVIIPAFNKSPALCFPMSFRLLTRKKIPPMTRGNTNTDATCVAIWAMMGLAPRMGTVRPNTQAIAVIALNIFELVSNSPLL